MKMQTIPKLCCPFDKSDLQLEIITKDLHDEVIEGLLTCDACKRIYPIVSGIPIMNPDEYREFSLEQPLLERWSQKKVSTQFRLLDN